MSIYFHNTFITTGNTSITRSPFMNTWGLAFLIIPILFMISCSSTISVEEIASRESKKILSNQQSRLRIYIHGSGDTPSVWAESAVTEFGGIALDWSEQGMSKLSAPSRGYEIGVEIGSILQSNQIATPLVLIAHSAGAWVAQGIADALDNKDSIEINFLDPFTAKSIFQPFSGSKMLGKNITHLSTYYASMDGIPFTNGKVSGGEVLNVDDYLNTGDKKSDAHWDVIDIYFDIYASSLFK